MAKKLILAISVLSVALVSAATEPGRGGRLLLIPLDDRPAVAQFAQMIGAVADFEVRMPPTDMLGRFTRPGDTAAIRNWLNAADYKGVDAIIVSIDMLTYGGLVASRTHSVALADAMNRLEFFRWLKKHHPGIPVYAFSVIMRVAPTADAATRPYRDDLARWSELMDRVPRTHDAQLARELAQLEKKLPSAAVTDYRSARSRDLEVNLAAVNLVKSGFIDSLLLLQDDARLYGLHRRDQQIIRERAEKLGQTGKVSIYNGTDEGSLSLVSRAILQKHKMQPRISVIYSSEKSREVVAPYEDSPLRFTVENQIRAAGGVEAAAAGPSDYLLFVNAPGTAEAEFESFLARMIGQLKEGKPVALADLLFPPPHQSGADERIVCALEREGLVDRLAGYAAWNTAGNTLGTAIPHANMRILSMSRKGADVAQARRSIVAHLEFLLHRFAGDYIYHDIVRPAVNADLRSRSIPTDELSADLHARVSREVASSMQARLEEFVQRNFIGRSYTLPGNEGTLFADSLQTLSISLPWPRTFEVRVEFQLRCRPNGGR